MNKMDISLILAGLVILGIVFSNPCKAETLHCNEFGQCSTPTIEDEI